MSSKKVVSFFTNEKHHKKLLVALYIVGILLCALLVLLVVRRPGSDDTVFQTQIQPYHTVFDWLSFRYNSWSGRIFSEAFVYIFSQLSVYAWKLVTIVLFAIWGGIVFLYYRLFAKKQSSKKDITMLILALLAPFLMDTNVLFDGMFWVTGAINYFWMTTLTLVAFYPVAYYTIRGSRPYWLVSVLSLISGVIAASSQEQAGLVLVSITLAFTIYLSIHSLRSIFKKIPLYPLLFLIIFAVSLATSLVAPGNHLRLQEETLTWLPDFYTIPLTQHIEYAYRWFLDALINHTGFLLVGSWLILLLLFVKKQSKDLLDRIYIGSLSVISLMTILKGFDAVSYWFTFYPTWHPTIPHKFSFLVLIPWAPILLGTIAAPLVLYRKVIRGYLVALLYTASFLSVALLTLSPTMYASGVRTLFTPSIVLIVVVYLLSSTLYDEYKQQHIETSLLLVTSIVASQYLLLASKIATTH